MLESRAALDSLVQGSAVDLFHSCGIAVAPVERCLLRPEQLRCHDLSAMIGFTARSFTGTLTVSMPVETFGLVKQADGRQYSGRDWVREIANQLCGRIKNRLLQFQVVLSTGLPATMSRDSFEQLRTGSPFFSPYLFRTLRGEIIVTIGGKIDHSVFVYSGGVNLPTEGDVILF